MAALRPLSGEQLRQLIGTEQTYEAFRAAQAERDQRFRGSMSWKKVGRREYLYRKRGDKWASLGPRSSETEQTFARFQAGRSHIRERIRSLDERIRSIAPINRAMRLGRVPWDAARILRKVERSAALRERLSVVGTHALYVYERLAGGHLHRSTLATDDLDLLFDDRRRMRVLIDPDDGLSGTLRAIDPSFAAIAAGSFRAVNANGFMVDLIKPVPTPPATARRPDRVSDDDELTAAEIEGLEWLQNSPQIAQVVIDERGYPLQMTVPDPRAFALHKLWVADQPARDRAKALRDRAQAAAVAGIVLRYLPALDFEGDDLRSLPAALRDRVPELTRLARVEDLADSEDWS